MRGSKQLFEDYDPCYPRSDSWVGEASKSFVSDGDGGVGAVDHTLTY